jgi:predicted nucleic acid-binding protein
VTLLLVDSSVWIAHLRDVAPALSDSLAAALDSGSGQNVCVCEPIAMELLCAPGAASAAQVARVVDGLPSLSVNPALDFRSASRLYRDARGRGLTVRSLVDCLIAAVAIRHDAVIVHRDRDFDHLAQVSPLQAQRW